MKPKLAVPLCGTPNMIFLGTSADGRYFPSSIVPSISSPRSAAQAITSPPARSSGSLQSLPPRSLLSYLCVSAPLSVAEGLLLLLLFFVTAPALTDLCLDSHQYSRG